MTTAQKILSLKEKDAQKVSSFGRTTKNALLVHVMHRMERSDPVEIRERIDVFLTAKKWHGKIKNLGPHKCDDLNWFDVNNLPKNIISYVKFAIDNIKDKKFYSEFGW